ncbi:DegQ family serine endoprotease [Spartinivicinus poritis]|uniref:DegQ family serine endoprotease n=1 Tax=Spartinivicinus poritis TaxID=2994640 RepID=A0ABT5U315_9GAMM|nr:DegQ family serine endoprotease [Spartinivicinus sp. A2-2]MDE1460764.1 DegQ family serine endoprotease [Spartinivicinus sp. A2-2]
MRILAILSVNILLTIIYSPLALGAIPSVDASGKPYPSLAPMLKQVNPAVVNIATYSTLQYRYNPLLNDPFFRHFFNIPDQKRYRQQPKKQQQSAGSGVIVNAKKGVVLTNYHVVKDADEVQVALIDGRSYQAKVIGSDPDLDIAVLKIDARNLTEVVMTDSNNLEVGDFVVAIGNPFGLGQTVTTGVVSALGRSGLGIEGYENFIQTDASINPGNSGGALVNLKGELVGINTAIIAPAGGNVGIGFAIPINMAKASMMQIIKHGEVRRGQIGVGIQDITPGLREAFNLANGQLGVLITHVAQGSPAETAGLKSGDVILAVDGKTTSSTGQLRSQLGIKPIGDQVKLAILREGKQKNVAVTVASPEGLAVSSDQLHPLLAGAQFKNNPDGEGILVASLMPNSAAAYSGLRPGDIIIGANKQRIFSLESFHRALQKSQSSVLLYINRNGAALYLVIR